MAHKAITQFVLIIVAIVIVFTYIKPTFAEIRITQDEFAEYADAVDKAAEFNRVLNDLLAIENSFSQQDRQALDNFLPTSIDDAQVMRDLENILSLVDVELSNLTGGEETMVDAGVAFEGDASAFETRLAYKSFELSVSGTYEELKDFLLKLEANSYIFEIQDLDFQSGGEIKNANGQVVASSNRDSDYTIEFKLRVYSLPVNVEGN